MIDFYYQVKARQDSDCDYSRWIWPPVFSGIVSATSRKEAREMVDAEYAQKFPMRVLKNDIETAQFLLNIREVPENDKRTRSLVEVRDCKQCGGGFRVVDHYNNYNQTYKGADFCSDECKKEWTKEHDTRMFNQFAAGSHAPVIYKIENIKTGMVYIGQTCQPFTLRWWQHFYHGTNTKFHQAIENSKMTDWIFQVVEVIEFKDIGDNREVQDFICRREQHWIEKFNSIKAGYNTATAKVMPPPIPLLEEVMND